MRLKKRDKYLRKLEEFVEIVRRFGSDFHIALNMLYDLFSQFHLAAGDNEDAITFAKSALVNTLKVCGSNHSNTAQAYYNLALIYIKASKIEDAISLLKKAKFIF